MALETTVPVFFSGRLEGVHVVEYYVEFNVFPLQEYTYIYICHMSIYAKVNLVG